MKFIKFAASAALAAAFTLAQAGTAEDRQKEGEAAVAAARAATVKGPSDVRLRDQAVLKLPAGMEYIPQPQAGRLMQAMGNSSDDRLIGLVQSSGESQWLVVARYENAGYIKDDDAKDWNVDDLFKSLKEGTEEGNKRRRDQGFPELEIVGWVQKPSYDAASHRLVWSMAARTPGENEAQQSINYNTYALGREGYITLNLITSRASIEADKPVAGQLLSALNFNGGKGYADFNSSTDKVAEYGLAALVAGVAVKKLGLFAVIAAFFLKFAKVALLAGAGLLAVIGKFFSRKKSDT
ncbi:MULTISPECIES: DUF2167 domain-containing protein [unclassified Rhizobacter]|uniref:DUF2167 domain-containing protein n=1 Tax=unclassified Rhizobacter TaxID=2640088 RepID=UPI0006F9ACA9|nr:MULTISPECIES: DUF2167 domain-containing protein [unclassified Rhizobacter]KQU80368.1 hypothetical protein ASC88_17220 [Rhizobacter sp. Root29]KQW13866.1 hypothetical protein ASC98_17350 [Rhizobacter sp. Root1238]KRB20398.1 hypothetical protein ASE08_22385 [Rhizobacter sp. Root16D2]